MAEVKVYDKDGDLKRIISSEEIYDEIYKGYKISTTDKKRLPKILKDIKCKGCEIIFIPSRHNNLYHSVNCRESHKRFLSKAKTFNKKCPRCLNIFIGTQSQRWCRNPCSYNTDSDGTKNYKMAQRYST